MPVEFHAIRMILYDSRRAMCALPTFNSVTRVFPLIGGFLSYLAGFSKNDFFPRFSSNYGPNFANAAFGCFVFWAFFFQSLRNTVLF